jgi:hypothetical protein
VDGFLAGGYAAAGALADGSQGDEGLWREGALEGTRSRREKVAR